MTHSDIPTVQDHHTAPARLRWRCRRGMLELDLLLLGFLDRGHGQLSTVEQVAFERLLQLPDQELLDCLVGGQRPKDEALDHVVERIRRSPAA